MFFCRFSFWLSGFFTEACGRRLHFSDVVCTLPVDVFFVAWPMRTFVIFVGIVRQFRGGGGLCWGEHFLMSLVVVQWRLFGTYGTSGVGGRGGGSFGEYFHMGCGGLDELKGTIGFFGENT